MLKLTNTLTGKKEKFTPIEPGKVTMYVCGVTPYDKSHLGHGRAYVAFDVLYRVLRFLGYDVSYCRNFTDIDDKLLNKAQEQFGDQHRYTEIADANITQYHKDMQALNCLPPDYEPRVTEHMPIIVEFIQGLVDADYAYQANGDVYFDIARFPQYGKLSKQQVAELRAGARVDVREKKRDPLDFALWKSEPEGTFWQSPWGYGRPGWHIECSALARHYLGKQIDIHGGGLDLIFPHHENEIAQSESLNQLPFVNYWLHNGLVQINQEKMSKSIGNVFALQDIGMQYAPMVLRFYLLNHHYRAPLDFSFDDLDAIQKTYQRLCRVFEKYEVAPTLSVEKADESKIIARMIEFLCDDLNTVGMLGVVFEHLDELTQDPEQMSIIKALFQQVLGLTLQPLPEKKVEITPEIQKLIDEREQAREEKDWVRADQIRDQLKEMGFEVRDEKISD